MSYTVQLKSICESFNTTPGASTNDIILNSLQHIFDFDFEIFEESYRETLESNIVRHYYFREIAFETYGQWKLKLQDRLNLIMPYYNQLFQIDIDAAGINLLDTTSITREHTRSNNGNTDTTVTGERTDWDVYSDTPQGSLTDVENNTYMANARKLTQNANNTTNLSSNDEENYLEKITGKDGGITFGEAVNRAHQAIHRTEEQFIKEFEDLFFSLWQ